MRKLNSFVNADMSPGLIGDLSVLFPFYTQPIAYDDSILSSYQFHSISVTLFWFVIDEVFYHYCASPVVHLISLVNLPIGFSIFFSTDSVNIQSKYAKFNEFP